MITDLGNSIANLLGLIGNYKQCRLLLLPVQESDNNSGCKLKNDRI